MSSEPALEQQPVHYKYAEKISHPVIPDDRGNFSLSIPVDQMNVAEFQIGDRSYPIVMEPGNRLSLILDPQKFPMGVEIEGSRGNWNQRYQSYLSKVLPIEHKISRELPSFRNGNTDRVLELYRERVHLAEELLYNTPLRTVYHANVGEYLNRALQGITYRKEANPNWNAGPNREEILDFARQHNFFSFESLKAQRAGIRDLAHYYSMSFDVQDSLRSIHGEQLSEQDIKRLGYDRLNRYREHIVEQIDDRRARAYADMHLVAERLGEMSLDIAEPTYREFLDTYSDFEEYTSFLTGFYEEITTVKPGEPAVPFTLPDPEGNPVSMSDFRGKYVLLDFWASWCVPCLNEFPDMKRIYRNTSREDFEIVAISIEEDSLIWRRALEQFDNPWIQVYGGNSFEQETFQEYKGGGIPFYLLINPEGTIERYNDIRATFNLESVLDSLLTHNPPN
ncbi:MAG: TlpA disulfide reductase family protein [Balneolaceae bacterium]